MSENDPLLTPEEVAEVLRISKRKVLDMLNDGVLPHLDIGYRTKRIRQSELDAFLEQGGVGECSS